MKRFTSTVQKLSADAELAKAMRSKLVQQMREDRRRADELRLDRNARQRAISQLRRDLEAEAMTSIQVPVETFDSISTPAKAFGKQMDAVAVWWVEEDEKRHVVVLDVEGTLRCSCMAWPDNLSCEHVKKFAVLARQRWDSWQEERLLQQTRERETVQLQRRTLELRERLEEIMGQMKMLKERAPTTFAMPSDDGGGALSQAAKKLGRAIRIKKKGGA